MNLRRAISIVRQAAKSDVEADVIADAIGMAGNYFLRETKMAHAEFIVDLDVDTAEFRIDNVRDFRPERLIYAETMFYQYIQPRDYREIAEKYAGNPAPSVSGSYPKAIGFRTPQTGIVYPPAAADNKEMRIVYYQPFSNIETHDDNTILNIPDEYIYDVLWYGATAVAEHRVPDSLFQQVAWQQFLHLTKKAKEETVFKGIREGPAIAPPTTNFRVEEGGVI